MSLNIKKAKNVMCMISCFLSFNVYSNNDIQILHSVLSHEQLDNINVVNLNLVINNNSLVNYHNLKISSSGNKYVLRDKNKPMTVGSLPASGQAVIQFTASTPRSIIYFQSGLPIFFHITAKQEDGQFIEIPVYSNREILE